MIVLYKPFQEGLEFRILFPASHFWFHLAYGIVCLGYSIALQFGIDSCIYFRCLYADMSKDVSNDNQAYARLQQMHCAGVPETVRGNFLFEKVGIYNPCRFDMFIYDVRQSCCCQFSSPRVIEKRMSVVLRSVKSMLSHIRHYEFEDVLIKRYASLLTSFTKELGKIWIARSEERRVG